MAARMPINSHWTTFVKGQRKPGTMNKTEAAYATHLEGRKVLGEVVWFAFEALSFRLGEGASYRPDFAVMLASGVMELIEVKGFWAEAARVRIKVAADRFPFVFRAVKVRAKKDGGGWSEEIF